MQSGQDGNNPSAAKKQRLEPPVARPVLNIVIPQADRPTSVARPTTGAANTPSSPISPFSPTASNAFSSFTVSTPSTTPVPPPSPKTPSKRIRYIPVFTNTPTLFPLASSIAPVKGPRKMSTPKTPPPEGNFEYIKEPTLTGTIQLIRTEILAYIHQDPSFADELIAIAGGFTPFAKDPSGITGLNRFIKTDSLLQQSEGAVALQEAITGLEKIVKKLIASNQVPVTTSSLTQQPAEQKATHASLIEYLARWITNLVAVYCEQRKEKLTVQAVLELYAMSYPQLAVVAKDNVIALSRATLLKNFFINKLKEFCPATEEKLEEALEVYLNPENLTALLNKNAKQRADSSRYFDLAHYPIEIIFNAFLKYAPTFDEIEKHFKDYKGNININRNDIIRAFNNAINKHPIYAATMMRYIGILFQTKPVTQPGKAFFYKLLLSLREDVPINMALVEKFRANIRIYRDIPAKVKEFTSDPCQWVVFPADIAAVTASDEAKPVAEPVRKSSAPTPGR